jgi:hypothetical protein
MELTEPIVVINKHLKDAFGIDTITSSPLFRIVWSEDQFEKRLGTYDDFSPGGIFLRTVTEVREAPKYRQWIKEKYVLERLVVVPEVNSDDLPESKVSYEPLWVFEDKNGNYLPPKYEAAKFAIDCVYAAIGKSSMAKYVDEEAINDPERKGAIAKIQHELFGDETDVTDALARKEGVVVPSNYKES